MKIKRLYDRETKKQVTPMTHYDSVLDSQGTRIREKFVPAIHTGTSYAEYTNPETSQKERAHQVVTLTNEGGFMSSDMLKAHNYLVDNSVVSVDVNSDTEVQGKKIIRLINGNKVELTRTDLTDSEIQLVDPVTGSKLTGQKIQFSHKVIPTETPTIDNGMQEPSSELTFVNETSQDDGHVTSITRHKFKFPQKVYTTSNESSSVTYLVGTPALDGNNIHSTNANLKYDLTSSTLVLPHINLMNSNGSNGGIVGGSKGSLIYQSGTNITTMLDIGTTGQVLRVKNGAPSWEENTGISSVEAWTTSNVEGPKTNIVLDDTNSTRVRVPAIPAASANEYGVVSTVAQTFSGDKTFNNNVKVIGDLTVQGNLISTHETDVVVSDKLITLATNDSASTVTGSGSGIEVTTKYNSGATSIEDKYQGPKFVWENETGWTTGSTDSSIPVGSQSLNIPAGAVYKIGKVQVMSDKQYIGNSATSNKVNHKLTLGTGKVFDGSADVSVDLDDISGTLTVPHGGTGNTEFTENALIYGNGTGKLKQVPIVKDSTSNPITSHALFQSAIGYPEFRAIKVEDIIVDDSDDYELVLMNKEDYGEVADFAV